MKYILFSLSSLFIFGCSTAKLDKDGAFEKMQKMEEIKRSQQSPFERYSTGDGRFLIFWQRWYFNGP